MVSRMYLLNKMTEEDSEIHALPWCQCDSFPSLFASSRSHVRDVDGRVKASLLRCRLLGGRVVNREDGLLGLLASFHLDFARDSLLFGHCCGCV